MRLAVCILHYGDPARTARLHQQFLASDPERAGDILVLDNASPEPYPEAWTRLSENIYWSGALAWTLDAAAGAGYTHLWFCNNDAEFVSAPPFVDRLTARWRRLEKAGRVGLIAPAVTMNPYHPQMTAQPGGPCLPARYVDGIAPALSLECLRDIGGLDHAGNPYGYGVDIWLSLRAARAGWGVFVDHGLVMRHRYHTAAREQDGFLRRAAEAEQAYLSARIGADWRKQIQELSKPI